jgi:hypothetical protein
VSLTFFARASVGAFGAAVGAPESYADFQAETGGASVERAMAELNAHLAGKGAPQPRAPACVACKFVPAWSSRCLSAGLTGRGAQAGTTT